MNINTPFAEIVESSLQSFKAHCWQWDKVPAFGSLITADLAGNRSLFGIVYHTEMGSMDPMRYPFPYQKTQDELLQEQPQIFSFLKTIISCLILGYKELGVIHYTLVPEPPKIHAFVSIASPELSQEFFSNNRYIHRIFASCESLIPLDELLLAILKYQSEHYLLTTTKLSDFIETFSLLSGSDYRRLKLFLQRAEPLLEK
jgi:hypothetical protein